MTSNSNIQYRPDIDGLRAIAVLSVVGFHVSDTLVPGGYSGVDVFFVISGYLISSIIFSELEEGTFSIAAFYGRRIRRIFPALFLVLAATWSTGWILYLPVEFANLGKHVAAGATFVSNFTLWGDAGYFDPGAASKPLLHLWSLGIEEQFYIVWPVLVILAWRYTKRVAAVIMILAISSFVLNVSMLERAPVATFYFPLTRMWELLAGSLLAYARLRFDQQPGLPGVPLKQKAVTTHGLKNVAGFSGVLLLAASLIVLNQTTAFPGWWALLPVAGTLLVIGSGPDTLVSRKILASPPLVGIGLISYPLYLWHWPLLSFWRDQFENWSTGPSRRSSVILVAIALLLSFVTYKLVEKPIRGTNQSNRRLVTGTLLLLMTAAGAIGLATLTGGGFDQRLPEPARKLLGYRYEPKVGFREGTCLLSGTEIKFADECLERDSVDNHAPVVLLWGDSHAAQLRSALGNLHTQYRFALAQFTSSSCPPVFGFEKKERPLCRSINDEVGRQISKLKPRIVILAHDWLQSLDENAVGHLGSTVDILRRNGVVTIVIVGPVPHWYQSLPRTLAAYMHREHLTVVPSRMKFGVVRAVEQVDKDLSQEAARLGVVYVSPWRVLCNVEGCLTNTGALDGSLTAFDSAHLTPEGANMVITQTAGSMFGRLAN